MLNPGPLSDDELAILQEWLPTDEPLKNPMEVLAYNRNIQRTAGVYGSKMIVILRKRGMIDPNEDPCEALENILSAGLL